MDTNTNLLELQVAPASQVMLRESAKWAKFLSIVGFVLCGVFVVIGIFAGAIFSTMDNNPYGSKMPFAMGSLMTVIYVIFALIYFFPCLFLFKFGSRLQSALRSHDQQQLDSSLSSLRSYFRFLGILTIIGLSFWVLALVAGGLGAALSGMK